MKRRSLGLDADVIAWVDVGGRVLVEGEDRLLELSFEALYRAEHARLVRRVFLIVGSTALAEDVVHETFVEVFRRWSTLDAPGAYLQRSVMNNAARCAKRARREVSEQPVTVVRSAGLAFDDVRDALVVLPFRQRAAIVLRYYEGLTEREIAELLRCRPGTVGPLITRGLRRLQEVIER
jgi:RNA polymerase sigma factor (sigma-70 family)